MATKKPPSVKTIDGLLKAMLVMSRTVDSVLETQAVEAAVGTPLSASKVEILRLLSHRKGQTASQVARFLGVSNPAVSQIIDTMVRDKLVVRKTAKHDRREVNLMLTGQGQRWAKTLLDKQRQLVRNAIRDKRVSEIGQWAETIEAAAGALVQGNKAYSQFCAQCSSHGDDSCILTDGGEQCQFMETEPLPRRRRRAGAATGQAKAAASTNNRRRTKAVRKKVGRRRVKRAV